MRIRWDNVARLAALAAVVALVAAWPRLGGGPPDVPAGVAVPVVADGQPDPEVVAPQPRGAVSVRRVRRPRRLRRHRRTVRPAPARRAPMPMPTPAPSTGGADAEFGP